MKTLYDLSSDYRKVQDMMEEGDHDLFDTLESINDAIEVKLDSIGKVLRNLEGQAEIFKQEEKRLAERRRTIENNIKNLKAYTEDMMIKSDIKKMDTGLFKFNIQKNPPSVQIIDESVIPKKYFIPSDPKLDKKTIKELLKNGESVEGVELVQGEGLRIK
ncbi:siphovirus Gp157 family protein [Gracilibacillus dipsosauri]|uniref:siphovirus Gp157 family protein n=1 Tax=Gracilibacillus dipsosauri TaxID=178340 RepID=UPI0024093C12